jgi:hypothetical protein
LLSIGPRAWYFSTQLDALRYRLRHTSDGLGLYLQVRAGGAKSWIFRYRTNGKLRDMGLGSVNAVSLAQAREKAAACRNLRANGIAPIDAKREEKAKASSLNKITHIFSHTEMADLRNLA